MRGCLLGGAAGDALGAPFEGLPAEHLPGEGALAAGYSDFADHAPGEFTDDTQLTLATVSSIVERGELDPDDVARRIAGLWASGEVIAPGGACTAAALAWLDHGNWRRSGAPHGQAGNGTAMRTAAVGLWFCSRPDELVPAVADICRITHTDPRSVAGGVAVAEAARWLAAGETIEAFSLCRRLAEVTGPLCPELAALVQRLPGWAAGDDRETRLGIASAGTERWTLGEPIVTGFVVPTVLAALWSVLRRPDSWTGAVALALSWGGDVDTLGAIAGALAGARLGAGAIPAPLLAGLAEREAIDSLARRYHGRIAERARRGSRTRTDDPDPP